MDLEEEEILRVAGSQEPPVVLSWISSVPRCCCCGFGPHVGDKIRLIEGNLKLGEATTTAFLCYKYRATTRVGEVAGAVHDALWPALLVTVHMRSATCQLQDP
ncbi:unnamed protein product [Clonostachys rosea]|uniref:Uncharacterized protein n=1 Tax=Bionectria ochroleuca TaxID=29856 RepID=A0ABY6V1K6_BIOOC|nr:unnamed protein product [Clonostachys rosea]